jgi:hypothetical protein
MSKLSRWATVAALTAGAFLVFGGASQAEGVKAGVLKCDVSGGWGLILGSSKDVSCVYSPPGGPPEHYAGKISKFGVDIGYQQSSVIIWGVIAPTANVKPGALAGDYAGATGGASVGAGAGANVLVGGSNQTISLQPVSVEGSTGLNVAGGIGALSLSPAP